MAALDRGSLQPSNLEAAEATHPVISLSAISNRIPSNSNSVGEPRALVRMQRPAIQVSSSGGRSDDQDEPAGPTEG